MSEQGPPEEAADDVTVGAWLDSDSPSVAERPTIIPDPVEETPGRWAQIKRALGFST